MVRITLNKPMPEIPDPVVITAVKYGLLYNHPAITDTQSSGVGIVLACCCSKRLIIVRLPSPAVPTAKIL